MKSADHLIIGGPALGAWPTRRGEKLRPHKGGGGGDGGAAKAEEDRQARQRAALEAINNVFNSANRDQLYQQQQEAVTQLNQQEVLRQQQDAERQNRFGLARAGLSGGSVDVDSNAEIGRIADEGIMKAVGIGQNAAADLRMQDERTRQSLIGMAQSGIDSGAAAQSALSGLSANAANAASAASGAQVGSLFGDLANAYMYNQQMQAFQQGMAPYRQERIGNASVRSGGTAGRVV
ncbi:hypothetical protein [Pusillimonas minor]|uniref:Uncharacterized protein n=1 Tax=Pusillimonas minor TaxID=2697024 RepID=A0A842HLZ0_9BURK|nr:hypothetical protein [Pusillimonas minor]MBC2768558.1 hypothetical protein [Pusillimonas minor]